MSVINKVFEKQNFAKAFDNIVNFASNLKIDVIPELLLKYFIQTLFFRHHVYTECSNILNPRMFDL